jgi:hypothetical protein
MSAKGYGVRPQEGTQTKWECYNMDTGEAVLSNMTNQEAWREVDRQMREANSRAESVTDWIWQQVLNDADGDTR